jgi:hypothetical protein
MVMMMVVMMMMMVVVAEVAAERTNDDVMMMVVMVSIENLRHLHFVAGLLGLLRHLRLIRPERCHRVRDRSEQIPVARRFGRLRRRGGMGGCDGRQGGSGTEKTRYSLVHVSSKRLWTFQISPANNRRKPAMFRAGTEIAVRIGTFGARRRPAMAQAIALGRADTAPCQRRTWTSSSGTPSLDTRMKSTAASAVMSATL